MVSGFLTSPCDHSRIFSGLASEMRIALNESGSLGFSKKLKMSRMKTSDHRSRRLGGLGGPLPPHRHRVTHGSLLLRGGRFGQGGLDQLDVQTQRLQLLDEHVEALRQ